ncbi:MAG: hypothetical protein QGI86_28070 [Candidatus Poribacteria bacterium]|nr:hypothetical protein [Candidatus Poribacteria bacterium]MDP6999034.1 hypothetical protein [Candidatus Poribacteria bacterium]
MTEATNRKQNYINRQQSWLIESRSLLAADGSSDHKRLYVKTVQDGSRSTLTTIRFDDDESPLPNLIKD